MRKEEKKNKHQSAVLEEWQHIWIYWCFSLELKHSGFCSIIPKNKNQKKQIENSKNLKFFPNKMIRRQKKVTFFFSTTKQSKEKEKKSTLTWNWLELRKQRKMKKSLKSIDCSSETFSDSSLCFSGNTGKPLPFLYGQKCDGFCSVKERVERQRDLNQSKRLNPSVWLRASS